MPKYTYGSIVVLTGLSDDLEAYNGQRAEVQYHIEDGLYEIKVLDFITLEVHEEHLQEMSS